MSAVRLLRCGTFLGLAMGLAAPLTAQNQPLTLKRAVELALAHSVAAGQSSADVQRASASYRESRNQYFPQVNIGSGLGDTWGYPLSLEGIAPSLVNVTAQSPLFNPSLRDDIRAAGSEYKAVQFTAQDQRRQIIQETVLAYVELTKWQKLRDELQQHQQEAAHSEEIEKERVEAGVDSQQLSAQTHLSALRAQLHVDQAESAIHEMQSALSQLTGVPVASLEVASESVPALPETPAPSDPDAVAASNPGFLFAREHAAAEGFRARAEHRALWPTADFATQYAVLAKFNNWLQFFPNSVFQRNNATIGVVIRFPIFNAGQRAHAAAADAEAVRANKDAEEAKNRVSQQVLKLQDSVRQLSTAKEVSDLEYEIATTNSEAVDVRVNSGSAAVPDAASAKSEMFEKYDAAQDADLALFRAKIGLLSASGDLEAWAEGKR